MVQITGRKKTTPTRACFLCAQMDLNHRPPVYKTGALTTELWARKCDYFSCKLYLQFIIKNNFWQGRNIYIKKY